MNQARKRTGTKKVLSMILVLVMLLSLLSMAAFTLPTAASSDSAASNDDSFYRIVHLDCGRKYFSKDWIIALLNEMKADGYNQLQLAFGNDGLRFLLDDMSFTANGTNYSHSDVVSKVEAGNKLQNSSGDASWLTQSEMDDIISAAKALGIEIVPLLNLPGHANTILDIADNNTYNAKISGEVSQNTLDVTNDAACSFGYEIFKKYVDYFSSKGCKYFNFGADEYGNDTGDKNPHFNVLQGSGYEKLSTFINELAAYIGFKNMTPRTFNDALHYNGWDMKTSTNTAIETIQCCYWSSGWGSYPVAPAETIANKGHDMINTNGDYYYVLGKADKFDSDYNYASKFSNTAFMGSTVNSPVGSMFCIWCDYPNAETEQTVAQKVRLPMRAMALRMENQSIANMDESVVTKGFNANGSLNAGSTVTPDTSTSTKDIYVAVNGTATVTVPGTYSGPYTTDDTSIATVTTNTTTTPKKLNAVTSIESGKQYLIVNNRRDENNKGNLLTTQTSNWYGNSGLKLTGEASTTSTELWTIRESGSGYEVMRGSNYLTIGQNTAFVQSDSAVLTLSYNKSGGYWNISQDSFYLNNLGDSETAGGWKWENNNNAPTDGGSQWKIYEITGGEQTTITFNGVAEGTTSVKIGGVTYTIHVTAEDLKNVTPLTIEYWITNQMVTADGATSKQIKATDPSVNSESGAKFSDLVPATGRQNVKENVFWKGTRLTSSNKQTADNGVDQTRAGNDFTYIRYWNQKWSFSVDGKSWTDFNDDDQVVAYYLQKTDVTSEITTNVVDWGQPYSEWKAGGSGWFWDGYVENGSKYVFLDFAVVYEDNTQNPSSFPTDKTLFYHFDGCSETNPRVLGAISFTENSDYEIWKVTVTDGTSTGYSSYSTFAPTYDNTTETTVWDESMGGIPQIDQLKYTANRSGKLVRVYVRAKVTEDSLTVNYFDENNTSLPFYSYNIAVASGKTFNEGFVYSNGALINNTVTNIKGVTQAVNWKLEEMSEIGAQYRFGNYTFTNATKEAGDKVVNLYYRFNSEKTFVVDFGLPLHITKTDISPKLSQANIEGVTVGNSLYATINANADYSIDYILNKTIDGSDRVTVTYSGTNKDTGKDDSATYNLTIIPATSVYYEDSFATFTDGTGNASAATWSTDKDGTAAKATTTQALSALGSKDVYGHDTAYADSTKLSMGSARKVTVSAGMVKDWTENSAWPTATFTFKGTGFDIISLTDNTSGEIFVDVYAGKEATGTPVKQLTVNNYYGYKQDENGKWVVDTESSNALYQIPVMKVSGLDYGEYTAVIRVAYAKFFDTAKKNQYNFWLDAIRVYDPMGKDNDTYKQDNEGYPQYIKLRDQLAKENGSVTTNTNLLFIDGAEKAEIATYANYGPNNEVYLTNGQAITFTVPKNVKIASIQIGAKAPDGSAAKMNVNGADTDISSATEMYYEIGTEGRNFTIANNGNGILSLTNLKITFTTSGQTVTLSAPTAEEQTAAVMSVRALFAAPEQTFEPEHFTAKWSRNVRKGGTATLTVKASADVESITVNGEEITVYTTKTARSFWGSKETYHVFTYRVMNAATADYSVCAVNADGAVSDPITATLTVRPSIRDWWNGIFDKWKH